MSETKKVFRWWWPWQTDKIENMLEDMAAQGWMLVYVRNACTNFVFEKRLPAKVRFCLDYQEKEKPEYLTLLADAGWKMEYRSSGWYIWSKSYDDVKPDLFTDIDSLIRRNNTILGSLTAVFAAQIPLVSVNMHNLSDKSNSPFMIALMIVWGIVIALLAGTVIGMALGTRSLKRMKGLTAK